MLLHPYQYLFLQEKLIFQNTVHINQQILLSKTTEYFFFMHLYFVYIFQIIKRFYFAQRGEFINELKLFLMS